MRKKKMPEFPVFQVIRTFYIHYNNSAIALINCSLFNTVGFSILVIKARSFCHLTALDRIDSCFFQSVCKIHQFLIAI